MEIRVIKNESQYRSMLHEAERLVALDPTPNSTEAEQLELLSVLIEDFEKKNFPFEAPDPIEAIEFRMMEQGLRQIDLAPMLGSRSRVSEILSRKRPLSVQMIRSLSKGLGIPAEILLLEGEKNQGITSSGPDNGKYDWGKFPIKEMLRRGWLNIEKHARVTDSVKKAAGESLRAFLEQAYADAAAPALFRRTFRGDVLDEQAFYSTLVWSARVLARAKDSRKKYKQFDPSTLNEAFFEEIAHLSRLPEGPKNAIEMLAVKGIAVIIEPKLPKTMLDGAALLLENGLPVIGMTLRYDRVDYFWFTLLHEMAHVWKHLDSPEESFIDRIESAAPMSIAEKQANRIARDALIPRAIWKRSSAFLNPSRESITQLARELSIHPAIIVGRLQQETGRYDMFRDMLGQNSIKSLFPKASFS